MATGIVKWFSNSKGYGFIAGDDGVEDIFAHFSTIDMEGYKTLKRGQAVVFELTTGPKGLHAQNIRPKAPEDGELDNGAPAETERRPA
ncbi:MAG: hypothetical protein BMS9Abin26_2081 [Gammaproteobacteria bacterium]|nr:MAG: hypothetical protein BMS9Abin26_2081 [Gammaproteobacteria bacterium]